MKFYAQGLFHIYNQGNNRQQIFFSEENYDYFLWKMKIHLLPFGDIVAYCLMPNHFHILFKVHNVEISKHTYQNHVAETETERRQAVYGSRAIKVQKPKPSKGTYSLNEAIGKLQSSYTLAINKENDWSGSLFRKSCKAEDGWNEIFTNLKSKTFSFGEGNDYAFICFNYIHNNPVKSNLVINPEDYKYSSSRDYKSGNKILSVILRLDMLL